MTSDSDHKPKMIDCVFAYGTLMRGYRFHGRLGEVAEVRPARTSGQLFAFDFRDPILVDGVDGVVKGQVVRLRFPRDGLKTVDDLRGFTEYDPATLDDLRIVKEVEVDGKTLNAYCYVFPAEKHEFCLRAGVPIESGDFDRFQVAREYLF